VRTGRTSEFTDAWFMGFTPSLTAGVWMSDNDEDISPGNQEIGAASPNT
jgi:penicillin-binding protein 1A